MATVAIVHDYLTQRGGAERVVLALASLFPEAPVYTTVWDRAGCYPEFAELDIRTSLLDRVGLFRRDPRAALPLLAPVMASTRVDADVVVCSSSGWAHGVGTTGRRLVYCHTPARWLYQRDRYGRETSTVARAAARALGPPLRVWDRRAARSADRYLANSTVTATAIRDAYGIDATIVHPPVTLGVDGETRAVDGIEPGFVLCIARRRGYKNVSVIVEAAADPGFGGRRLVVVGRSPEQGDPPAVASLGRVDDATMRWLHANAGVLVAAAYEDFGLTPVEAAAAGVPTAALRAGGYLDTVIDGETGLFFDTVSPGAIADVVGSVTRRDWDRARIRASARRFSPDVFGATIRRHVDELTP